MTRPACPDWRGAGTICGAAALLTVTLASPATGQEWLQRRSPEQLLQLATEAYRALPERPSPSDAPTFLRALANLHAYAELSRDANPDIPVALEWLHSNLRSVTPAGGKGDDPAERRSVLEARGLAAYDSLRSGRAPSPFRSYVVATTNLYVARQLDATIEERSMQALGWLGDHPVVAGVKGDFAGESAAPVLPAGPKPRAFESGPPAGVVQVHPGVREIVGQARPPERVARPGAEAARKAQDLTGRWQADDGGTYYIRQLGTEVWWLGQSADGGTSWSNIFHGTLDVAGGILAGRWVDVPLGRAESGGELKLEIFDGGAGLRAVASTGGFGGRLWRR